MNPAWVAFFAEALRLAELKRQRQAANSTGEEKRESQVSAKDTTGKRRKVTKQAVSKKTKTSAVN